MSVSRFTPISVLVCGALALPSTATASTSASMATRASTESHVNLEHVAQLAARAHRLNRHERVLLRRSQREMRRAADVAQTITAGAQSPIAVQTATQTDTSVSDTLSHNASLLAQITLDTSGSTQSQSAGELLADVQMQTAMLDATVAIASDQVGAQSQEALRSASAEVSATSLEVNSASTVAGSPSVSGNAQASAELAMASGTQELTNVATTLSGFGASVQASGQAAWGQLEQSLSAAASHVSVDVEDSGTGGDTVTVDGGDPTTLETLAQLSVETTSASSTGSGPDTASAQSSFQGTVGWL